MQLAGLLNSLRGSCSMMVVEHDMEFVAALAGESGKVSVLAEGSLLAEGTLEAGEARRARDRVLSGKVTMLQVNALNQFYGGSHILRDISFEVPQGKLTTLLGRNGVGKSTLLKCLMGVVPTRSGHISWEGKALEKKACTRRARRAWPTCRRAARSSRA